MACGACAGSRCPPRPSGCGNSPLGIREVTGSSPTALIIEHLRSKSTLLLLDNCEHVIEECARLVGALLRACPHLSVLASSREALGIGGETPYRVPSLPSLSRAAFRTLVRLLEYEAVKLFVERARLAEPSLC